MLDKKLEKLGDNSTLSKQNYLLKNHVAHPKQLIKNVVTSNKQKKLRGNVRSDDNKIKIIKTIKIISKPEVVGVGLIIKDISDNHKHNNSSNNGDSLISNISSNIAKSKRYKLKKLNNNSDTNNYNNHSNNTISSSNNNTQSSEVSAEESAMKLLDSKLNRISQLIDNYEHIDKDNNKTASKRERENFDDLALINLTFTEVSDKEIPRKEKTQPEYISDITVIIILHNLYIYNLL